MKLNFPPRLLSGESAIRPGFDVFMAVTGARQAASPTARSVAAIRPASVNLATADQRRALLATGRLGDCQSPANPARFADVAPIPATSDDDGEEVAIEMNGLFTRAFQRMVKHGELYPVNKVSRLGGTDSGMK